MNRYGMLGRYMPAFGRIVGQMQHDLFHVYTVDEHILMVVRNLRRFLSPSSPTNIRCAAVSWMISSGLKCYTSPGLFHDIAKGRDGDHSKLGKNGCPRFCRRQAFPRKTRSWSRGWLKTIW